jgi:hypothetical protein
MMSVEKSVELLARGAEVLVENLPQCPLQMPHDVTWFGTWTAAMRSQCLTVRAAAASLSLASQKNVLIRYCLLPWR